MARSNIGRARTAFGKYKRGQWARAGIRGYGLNVAAYAVGATGAVLAETGVGLAAGIAGGLALRLAGHRQLNKSARAAHMGNFVERLTLARGGAKRSSTVMRAARTMNRSVKRSGGNGQVKGYYRQGPGGQVYVKDYQRRPGR